MLSTLVRKLPIISVLILPILGLMISCSPEYPLAKAYIKQVPKGSILLMRPDFVYKSNMMRFDLSDKMSENEKDSVSYYRSSYLQYVSDSAFLDEYINKFIDRLLSAGFDVYAQDYLDSFMNSGSPAYIVNLAQLQLEESRDTAWENTGVSDEEGNYTYRDLLLNTVRLNSWLEVTELNADSGKVKKLFFASSIARDAVKTGLILMPEVGDLRFQYIVDTLRLNDLYELAWQSGKTYGDYLVDYFMNEYIRLQMPNSPFLLRYLHYDPDLRRVSNSHGEGFLEIEPDK